MVQDLPAAMVDAVIANAIGLTTGHATRFQLLPDVVDLTFVPTGAGFLSLMFTGVGVARGFPVERVGRLSLAGNLVEALAAVALVIFGRLTE